MRILLVWAFLHPDPWGPALASRGEAFTKYMTRSGHVVRVFAPDYGTGSCVDESIAKRVPLWEGLRHRDGVLRAAIAYPRSFMLVLQMVREFNPDIIVVSQPTFTLPIQVIALARLAGTRVVVDMQDIFTQFQEFYPHHFRGKLRLLLEHIALREADWILPVLPAMQELAQTAHGIPPSRFYVVYNGFDSELFHVSPHSWEERDIDLLHLGAPREYYLTESLIDALEALLQLRPETNLVFTDFVGTPYQEKIRGLVHQKGLDSQVRFLKHQPAEAVLAMIGRAKLGVYTLYGRPSSRVVVGTKTFEYLASGLPIAHLGPESGEMTRLIREHGGGFAASDAKMWANLASQALSSRATWEVLSQKALHAAAHYDWKHTVPQLCREVLEPLKRRGE